MRGFAFNGKHSSEFGIVQSITRDILPGARDRSLRVPGRDGEYFFGRDIVPYNYSVRMLITATSFTSLRAKARQVAGWLNAKELKSLVFDDESHLTTRALVSNRVSPDKIVTNESLQFGFWCPDGFAESIHTKNESPNSGTIETHCIITATVGQQMQSLRITLAETGEFVLLQRDNDRWPVTLQAGDVVTIDTARHLTLVNGTDARAGVAVASDYFKLPPGDFNLVSDPGNVTIEVEYKERWT